MPSGHLGKRAEQALCRAGTRRAERALAVPSGHRRPSAERAPWDVPSGHLQCRAGTWHYGAERAP